MKSFGFVARIGFALLTASVSASQIIDFDALTPRDTSNPDYWNPNPGFSTGGLTFSGGSYSGFVVSNSTTLSPGGYIYAGNDAEVSAFHLPGGGGASGSSNFAVAYNASFFNLPAGMTPLRVDLTNTTTAYRSMENGDFFAKQFGGTSGDDPDFFDLILTGYTAPNATGSVTGSVTFRLADFTFADNTQDYIVDTWTSVDLTGLGPAASVGLSWDSSDVGGFGINTPTYVAIDNLEIIPEPGTLLLTCAGLALLARTLRRRRT